MYQTFIIATAAGGPCNRQQEALFDVNGKIKTTVKCLQVRESDSRNVARSFVRERELREGSFERDSFYYRFFFYK